jgi:hypothetical protein
MKNGYNIEKTATTHTYMTVKMDGRTWFLSQEQDTDMPWSTNDCIVLNRDDLKTLHAALTEIIKED